MEIRKVSCCGVGTIGCGWAANLAWKGVPVTMYNKNPAKLEISRARVEDMLRHLENAGVLTAEETEKCKALITYESDAAKAMGDADLIQECVPELMDVKQDALRTIEDNCREDAIIATNTSSFLVTDLAGLLRRPERLVGGHPFTPVYLIPLVEVVLGEKTDRQCFDTLYDFYKAIDKEPVKIEKEVPGFIANRIQAAVTRELRDLILKGVCSVEDADKAVAFGPGLRWGIIGPNMVAALNGGPENFTAPHRLERVPPKAVLSDLATWDQTPMEYRPMHKPGLEQAMANRAPGTGQNYDELLHYRDEGLLALLRFHKKI